MIGDTVRSHDEAIVDRHVGLVGRDMTLRTAGPSSPLPAPSIELRTDRSVAERRNSRAYSPIGGKELSLLSAAWGQQARASGQPWPQ